MQHSLFFCLSNVQHLSFCYGSIKVELYKRTNFKHYSPKDAFAEQYIDKFQNNFSADVER